ncbi:MAG: Hpt domain-containing protein [Agarilytica sp.]
MGDKRNFAALDWVVDEISDTLKEARQSLEAYVEDPKDSTRIRFCLTHIHQVHGSLQMVEFHGAALLAEEMEQAAQAIMDHEVASIPEAQEVLMRSLLQLPIFLENVKSTKEDSPARIMPLLNDLRAVRKQSYLSETNLFSPDLSSIQSPSGKRHPVLDDKVKLNQVVKKLREMYQFAAASVLRGIKVEENLEYLDKVFSRLELITQGTLGNPIWEVSAALIDALKRDELELTVGVKGLMRYIARDLRILGEQAPEILDQPPRESLLKNLLYYVSRAEDGSEKVAKVYTKYGLGSALVGSNDAGGQAKDDMLQAPDASAIRSVVVALQDEIGNIKHVLDLSLSGQGGVDDLKEVLPSVKRVTDTLAVLGIGDLRKQMLEQAKRLEEISEANSIDEKALMQTASSIIEIEHRLKAIAKSAGKHNDLASVNEREVEIDNAKAAVVKECSAGLLKSKESIIEYISSNWDKKHLEDVDSALKDIRGGLNMIPLRRPAAIVSACGQFIQEKLIEGNEHPSFDVMESLADAIASVEYYLERLMEDLHEDSDSMLDIAEESIAGLGYPVEVSGPGTRAEAPEPRDTPKVQETPEAVEQIEPTIPEPEVVITADVSEPEPIIPEPVVEDLPVPEEAATPELVPEPMVEPANASAELTPVSVDDEDESDIDDEIIEIFIEEAGEVLETLEEYVPQWRAKESDQDALVVVRRAFHTLKGSGRMVEAFDIGELAWSVENMLNRVIDRTIKVTPHVFNLVNGVIAVVPTLVEAFKCRAENPIKSTTDHYQALGHELAEGRVPDELAEPLPPIDTPVVSAQAQPEPALQSESQPVSAPEYSEAAAIEAAADAEDDEEFDLVLQEIFSQESITHLGTVQSFIAQMVEDAPLYSVPTDEFQRALHTLKGSAKMAQVWPIAEIAEPLEHFMKELITFQVQIDEDILQLIRDAADYIRAGVSQIESGNKVSIPKVAQFAARTQELRDLAVGHLVLPKDSQQSSQKVDPRMLSLVMAEEMALLLEADALICRWENGEASDENLDNLLKELSVLEEGARQAHLHDMSSLTALLSQSYEQARAGRLEKDEEFFTLIKGGHNALLDMVDAVAAAQNVQAVPESVSQGISQLLERATEPAPEAAPEDSVEEEHIDFGDLSDLSLTEEFSASESESHAESGESDGDIEFEDLPAVDDISFEVAAPEEDIPLPEIDTEELSVESVADVTEESATENTKLSGDESAESQTVDSIVGETEEDIEETLELESASEAPSVEQAQVPEPVSAPPVEPQSTDMGDAVVIPGLIDHLDVNSDDYDSDIIEVFLEEADELIEGLDEAVHAWENNWSDDASLEEIKRILHTFKGGARLSGLNKMGDLTHDYESMLIDMGDDLSNVDDAFFASLHDYQDQLLRATRAVKQFAEGGYEVAAIDDGSSQADVAEENTAESQETITPEAAPVSENTATAEPSDSTEPEGDADNVVKFAPKPKDSSPVANAPAEFVMPTVASSGAGGQAAASVAVKKAGPQEVVKISAELLEELVNLAGETSINRSRLEQYVNDFGFSLDEIDTTLNRLQDQLRRLDMETEAQILFRQEQMEQHDEFDPLEMDRYSHLQQLSRSLIESASDLDDLKLDLGERLKSTETLLLQQSRVNTTLQEGLMRSRMVPFSRLVPRLRRIVRQVATELGKNVSFELDNVEGELDRSVLERMVPPFEHMLRNAVDHGIESPEDRMAAGKSESGRIVLTLAREGGDVLIRLADDGRGVDLKRVRQKAIERELMAPDAELSDHDIMQFILHAGFSTAENVTQISGRGVGMDVVHAEIKQLGGSVTINSAWGKGTEFLVRLPFTLSVNRALMVAIGNDHYAVPLSSIEGIVRVSPFELEHYYANPEAQFEYANENYHVRYLGSLLYRGAAPKLDGHVLPLPVLLVRSAEHTMALQVDAVMGSREIVVKSLGQQFSTVPGLSGATVMGDGSVVVILDPHALVRQEIARATLQLVDDNVTDVEDEVEEARVKQVMVVDDSVTVRKVTSRFLEREGFDVITAKDGVDAIRLLQEGLPDLMLLDIEMPRMDGFEVAKTVRSTKRWESLPIIMITSRTGDKHREHAESLGVNNYLGKPYQEDILLDAIGEILDHKS